MKALFKIEIFRISKNKTIFYENLFIKLSKYSSKSQHENIYQENYCLKLRCHIILLNSTNILEPLKT